MSKFYDLKAWKTLRANMLCEQPFCVHCEYKGIKTFASEVDHIVPVSKGGDAFDPDNLQCLCESCHSKKTTQDKLQHTPGCTPGGIPVDPKHHWNR